MRKLLIGIIGLLISTSAFANFQTDFRSQLSHIQKTEETPHEKQILMDYTGGPGDQPVYVGYAAHGRATSDDAWIIYKFTYSGANMTVKQTAYGTWDDRATHTYQ